MFIILKHSIDVKLELQLQLHFTSKKNNILFFKSQLTNVSIEATSVNVYSL